MIPAAPAPASSGAPSSTSRSGSPARLPGQRRPPPGRAPAACRARRKQAGDLLGQRQPAARRQVRRHPGRLRRAARPSRSAPQEAADPASRRMSLNGSHSACHAPAARWCSCSALATRVASRPGTCRAQPRMATEATGLLLFGIADDPPRRCAAPGPRRPADRAAPSGTSADLGLGEQRDVPGDLAQRGTCTRAMAIAHVDDPQPLGVPRQRRGRQSQFRASSAATRGPSRAERGQRPGRPAELHGKPLARGVRQPAAPRRGPPASPPPPGRRSPAPPAAAASGRS